jgi:hypothetical protein
LWEAKKCIGNFDKICTAHNIHHLVNEHYKHKIIMFIFYLFTYLRYWVLFIKAHLQVMSHVNQTEFAFFSFVRLFYLFVTSILFVPCWNCTSRPYTTPICYTTITTATRTKTFHLHQCSNNIIAIKYTFNNVNSDTSSNTRKYSVCDIHSTPMLTHYFLNMHEINFLLTV